MMLFITDFFLYRFVGKEKRERVSSFRDPRLLAFEIYGGKKEGWRFASVLFALEVRAPRVTRALSMRSQI